MSPIQTTKPITLLIDPHVLAMPIKEQGEPMVDLINQPGLLFGPSPEIPNNTDYTKMRRTVYQKLLAAQQVLPDRLQLCIYECYRSLALQEQLFNDRYTILKGLYAAWGHEQLFLETIKMVSPVVNLDGSRNIPPHSTGGAVDLYLVDHQGNIVDMGIKAADWILDVDGSISQTDSAKISKEAIKYRLIMNQALEGVGFVNYPGEYWHWSYGDRYWAYGSGQECAIYGAVV
jgi:zinc D-Ala-D-Ala dipeptidase